MENIDKIKCVLMDFEQNEKTLDEAANEILRLFSVIVRSEQLPCNCGVKLAETSLQVYCPKCWKTWKIKQGN